MSKEAEPVEGTQRRWVTIEGKTRYFVMDGTAGDYWFYGTPMGCISKIRVDISRCFETELACLQALLSREAKAYFDAKAESWRLRRAAKRHSKNMQIIRKKVRAFEKAKIKAA